MKKLSITLLHFILLTVIISCEKDSIENQELYEFKKAKESISISNAIKANTGNIFGVSLNKKDIFRYNNSPNNWSKIGGAGADWVWANGKLYGLSSNKSGVYEYTGVGQNWRKIGGPASRIFGGNFLLATNPNTGDIYQFKNNNWSKIGGAGADWVWANGKLYGLSSNKSAVYEYTGLGQNWNRVGGPASRIFGGDFLLATNPNSGDIYQFKNTNWTKIGGPGADWVWANGKLYGLSSNRNAVYEYTGVGQNWNRVGGAAKRIYGGVVLCATNPSSGDIYQFKNNVWAKIGGPGNKFIIRR